MSCLLDMDRTVFEGNPELKGTAFAVMSSFLQQDPSPCEFVGDFNPNYIEARVQTKLSLRSEAFGLNTPTAIAVLCRYVTEAVQILQLSAINDVVTMDAFMKWGNTTEQTADTLECLEIILESCDLERVPVLAAYAGVVMSRLRQLVGESDSGYGVSGDRDLLMERLASMTDSACALMHDKTRWVVHALGSETDGVLGTGTTPTFAAMDALTTIRREQDENEGR